MSAAREQANFERGMPGAQGRVQTRAFPGAELFQEQSFSRSRAFHSLICMLNMRDARLRPVVVMADSPTASGKSPSSELTVALTANCTSSGAVAAKSATSLGGSIPRSSLKKGFVGSASCVAHTGFPANQSESFATPCVLVGSSAPSGRMGEEVSRKSAPCSPPCPNQLLRRRMQSQLARRRAAA